MKTVGNYQFPETREEAAEWEPNVAYRALAMRVLVAAITRIEGAWSAYCDAVPGQRHEAEVEPVIRHGDKLPEGVARALFPWFEGLPYAK